MWINDYYKLLFQPVGDMGSNVFSKENDCWPWLCSEGGLEGEMRFSKDMNSWLAFGEALKDAVDDENKLTSLSTPSPSERSIPIGSRLPITGRCPDLFPFETKNGISSMKQACFCNIAVNSIGICGFISNT